MRVILDTNVFVSGVFFSGPPFRILEAWRDRKLQLIASQEILEEYQRVGETLAEQFPGVNLQPSIDLVTTNAEIFPNQVLPESVCEDPAQVGTGHLRRWKAFFLLKVVCNSYCGTGPRFLASCQRLIGVIS